MVNNEDETDDFLFEYDNSIYRMIELKRPDLVKRTAFSISQIENMYSVFKYYDENDVISVRFRRGEFCYIHEPFTSAIKSGELINPTCSHTHEIQYNINSHERIVITNKFVHDPCPNKPFDEIDKIIIKYMHDGITSIFDINMDELNNIIFFEYNWENFIKIPIFLYIIKRFI
jgi:hypothetical protein